MAVVPPVSVKGQPVPVERFAEFSPHRVTGDGVRTNTPARREALAVLARQRRGAL